MHREVLRYRRRLDHLFGQIAVLSEDHELQAQWARYLCILVSGFLEVSVRAIYGEYARNKAVPYVANFVDSQLEFFRNPKMGSILDLTGAFSREWEEKLRDATEGQLKTAVDSVVANRHRISHGEDVGITYTRIKEYYASVLKVVEIIDEQCNE